MIEKGGGEVKVMEKLTAKVKELGLTEDRAIAILTARIKTLGRAKDRREEVGELREAMKNPKVLEALRAAKATRV
jgi:hypothetical protein